MNQSRSLAKVSRDLDKVKRWVLSFESPIPIALRFKFKLAFVSFEFTLLAGYNQPSYTMEVIDVPKVAFESSEILKSVKAPSRGYEERTELRAALANLGSDQVIRLTPDEGESMRKLKRMVTEAGKDIDRQVKHVVDGGDLLVFVPAPKPEGAPRRGRPKKEAQE